MDRLKILLLCLCTALNLQAQEFNAKVIVLGDQVAGTDPKVFKTMEQDAAAFINTRKWGTDAFENKEKIECVFTLVLSKAIEGVEGGFMGRLSVQATRPVFNTSYSSVLVNFTDKDVAIKYTQFQPFDFNDNRVNGNDALVSNLTALLAFYSYMILGLDYDSFSLKGGTEFYNKALNIVNNAPEVKAIMGWKAAEGQRNRFWLSEQILNNRFAPVRDFTYRYHRMGLDLMSSEPEKARAEINSLFPLLLQVNSENPASMLMQFLMNAKSDEIRQFIALNSTAEKQKLIPMLVQLDVANAAKYAELLK